MSDLGWLRSSSCCLWSSSSSSSVTSKSICWSPRMTVTLTVSPISWERTAKIMASAEVICAPSTPMMMSPFWMPAASAGPPSVTSAT